MTNISKIAVVAGSVDALQIQMQNDIQQEVLDLWDQLKDPKHIDVDIALDIFREVTRGPEVNKETFKEMWRCQKQKEEQQEKLKKQQIKEEEVKKQEKMESKKIRWGLECKEITEKYGKDGLLQVRCTIEHIAKEDRAKARYMWELLEQKQLMKEQAWLELESMDAWFGDQDHTSEAKKEVLRLYKMLKEGSSIEALDCDGDLITDDDKEHLKSAYENWEKEDIYKLYKDVVVECELETVEKESGIKWKKQKETQNGEKLKRENRAIFSVSKVGRNGGDKEAEKGKFFVEIPDGMCMKGANAYEMLQENWQDWKLISKWKKEDFELATCNIKNKEFRGLLGKMDKLKSEENLDDLFYGLDIASPGSTEYAPSFSRRGKVLKTWNQVV